ncbi:uncharacterized protein LOC135366535 [Ornithodoros turicata]|uniref:uncharacterized protein LOC135366535 n=1 Tax=Ornithodoros turicata TaxID=34597 RepID=UPI003139AB29
MLQIALFLTDVPSRQDVPSATASHEIAHEIFHKSGVDSSLQHSRCSFTARCSFCNSLPEICPRDLASKSFHSCWRFNVPSRQDVPSATASHEIAHEIFHKSGVDSSLQHSRCSFTARCSFCNSLPEICPRDLASKSFHSCWRFNVPSWQDVPSATASHEIAHEIFHQTGVDSFPTAFLMFLHGKMFLLQQPPTKSPTKSSTKVELTVPYSILDVSSRQDVPSATASHETAHEIFH